jgi:anti-anti-sigma factor
MNDNQTSSPIPPEGAGGVPQTAGPNRAEGPAPAGGAFRLKLDGELNIGNAAGLQRTLAESLDGGAPALDLSAVTECDAAALQLICSWRKAVARRGLTARIAAWSPAVEDAAAAIGLPVSGLADGAEGGCDVQ